MTCRGERCASPTPLRPHDAPAFDTVMSASAAEGANPRGVDIPILATR